MFGHFTTLCIKELSELIDSSTLFSKIQVQLILKRNPRKIPSNIRCGNPQRDQANNFINVKNIVSFFFFFFLEVKISFCFPKANARHKLRCYHPHNKYVN